MKLVGFFNNLYEIINAAEDPFSKFAIVFLPGVAPAVPATLTGIHMYQVLLTILEFQGKELVSAILSVLVGIVLELLGYVGAITLIKSVFELIREGKDGYLIPFVINLLAYGFYLVLMLLLNVKIGEFFGVPTLINSIIGLLSFITVPTGLLAANQLALKDQKKEKNENKVFNANNRLRRRMIDKGMNPFETGTNVKQSTTPQVEEPQKTGDWRLLTPQQRHDVKFNLSAQQIMSLHNVSKSTAYAWKSDKYEV